MTGVVRILLHVGYGIWVNIYFGITTKRQYNECIRLEAIPFRTYELKEKSRLLNEKCSNNYTGITSNYGLCNYNHLRSNDENSFSINLNHAIQKELVICTYNLADMGVYKAQEVEDVESILIQTMQTIPCLEQRNFNKMFNRLSRKHTTSSIVPMGLFTNGDWLHR